MGFTFAEFLRGMWAAWGLFLAILVACLIVLPVLFGAGGGALVIVGYGLLFGGGISLAAMAVFSPVAWVLGWCLRRVRPRGVHLACFAGLGAVIGLVVSAIFAGGPAPGAAVLSLAFAVAAAISVTFGWRHASKRALDGDDHLDGSAVSAIGEPRVHRVPA
ncbi:hypothetical protein [Microbacterium sp. NPDC057650]|uniref:hypothetical protein n=1 Tax=unclassified Microbacterium TaxID=2609290 RepID=UPI00366E324C